jgi:hypothetical protein
MILQILLVMTILTLSPGTGQKRPYNYVPYKAPTIEQQKKIDEYNKRKKKKVYGSAKSRSRKEIDILRKRKYGKKGCGHKSGKGTFFIGYNKIKVTHYDKNGNITGYSEKNGSPMLGSGCSSCWWENKDKTKSKEAK